MKKLSATAELHLDKRRIRKDNTYPIKLKITFNRERKYYNTTLNVSEEDWDKLNSKRVIKSFLDTKTKLLSVKVSAQNCIDKLDVFSYQNFEDAYFPKRIDKHSVQSAYEEYIEQLREQERFGSADAYKTSMSALLKFKPRLKFEQVTPSFLEKFEKFQVNKGLSISTVGIYLRPLRAIVNKEIANGNFPQNDYPFSKGKYTIPTGKKAKKSLPKEVIAQIINYNASGDIVLAEYRDLWLFSFFCNGMNIADICHLKYEDFDEKSFSFYRQKTIRTYKSNPKQIRVVLTDRIRKILADWGTHRNLNDFVFPYLKHEMTNEDKKKKTKIVSVSVNTQMRKLASLIGFDGDITTYTARHSYATLLVNMGAPMELLKENFGHSAVSVTENYFDGFETTIQKSFAEKLGNMF